MKSISITTLLFFLFIAKVNGQYFNGYTYGNAGGRIYKADSTGNVVWAKNLGNFSPGSNPNWIHETVSDGRYVYTLGLNGNIFTPTPGSTYYQSIIVLDTNGNHVSTKYQQFNPANSYNVIGIYPSLRNGAFFADNLSPGMSHQLTIYKVNNTGSITRANLYAAAQYVDLREFISLNDSNYLAAMISADGSGGVVSNFIKLNESGDPIWINSYYTTTPGFERLDIQSMTQDSSGYIYLMCGYMSNSIEGICGIKIDLNGAAVIGKIYEGFEFPYTIEHKISFRNNQLIDLYNDSIEIVFDTLFSNTCLNPIAMNLVTYGGSIITQLSLASISYQSQISNGSITLNPYTSNSYNYCSLLNTNEKTELDISIFPNPTKDKLFIKSALYKIQDFRIKIFDITGHLIQIEEIQEGELNISNLYPGIYGIEIQNNDKIYRQRFIKE